MKISINWLRELCETPLAGAELGKLLTMAGLEVEQVAPFGGFSGVVAVEVRGKRPHPNSNKLTLVDVFDGREVTQVVCGAPNVPEPGPGAIVLWARPGARLPSGITLAPKEVRGVLSPGMLCAEDELGLGASHEGILILSEKDGLRPGDDAAEKLGLPDEILEINVTPNRPDCLGHLGIAREVAALTGTELRLPPIERAAGAGGALAKVDLLDADGCPRYAALVLDGITVGPSPLAVRLRLQSLGVRAISNVVDVTNLILLERGQPLHAFDLDRLSGHAIVVRRAKEGERIATLDGVERILSSDDVAICDAERPVAVAGVMGGATSEVSEKTRRVLLESAYFSPARVRRTARRLGLHTEASHRFERGADPEGVLDAAFAAAGLLQSLAGARLASAPTDLYPRRIEPVRLTLRAARTRALLGLDVQAVRQEEILRSLGLEVERAGETLHVLAPTRRPDLTREVDLIEEVARVHGYGEVGATVPPLRRAPGVSPPPLTRAGDRARDAMLGLGFEEVSTYAFVPPAEIAAFGFAADDRRAQPLRLQNPIREEQSAMRTTLLVGLCGALKRNLARGESDLRLFELGTIFLAPVGKSDTPADEHRHLAGILSGHREGWLKPGELVDFTDLAGAVGELLGALGGACELEPSRESWLHPGVQARISAGGRDLGRAGELHPDLRERLGLEARAFVFELDLGALGLAAPPRLGELPRFPAVTRDLSFFIDATVSAHAIRSAIDRARDPLCVEVKVLEDYREAGRVPPGKKGMLWSFTYRTSDRTLTDAEVQAAHERLLAGLKSALTFDPR